MAIGDARRLRRRRLILELLLLAAVLWAAWLLRPARARGIALGAGLKAEVTQFAANPLQRTARLRVVYSGAVEGSWTAPQVRLRVLGTRWMLIPSNTAWYGGTRGGGPSLWVPPDEPGSRPVEYSFTGVSPIACLTGARLELVAGTRRPAGEAVWRVEDAARFTGPAKPQAVGKYQVVLTRLLWQPPGADATSPARGLIRIVTTVTAPDPLTPVAEAFAQILMSDAGGQRLDAILLSYLLFPGGPGRPAEFQYQAHSDRPGPVTIRFRPAVMEWASTGVTLVRHPRPVLW